MITTKQLARLAELCGELETLLSAGTTFLYGDQGSEDIVGIVIADRETTDAILGDSATTDNMN